MRETLAATLLTLVAFLSSGGAAEVANQPPEGFVALFNGKNLDGWRGGSTVDPQKIQQANLLI